MVVNKRPKQKSTESKLAKLVSKENESDDNVQSATSNDKNNVVDNSTQNVVFEPNIEDELNIDFYNTSKVPNDEAELRSSDFDDIPKLPIISKQVTIRACAVNCL